MSNGSSCLQPPSNKLGFAFRYAAMLTFFFGLINEFDRGITSKFTCSCKQVFQQNPGTALVKGPLQHRHNPVSGSSPSGFNTSHISFLSLTKGSYCSHLIIFYSLSILKRILEIFFLTYLFSKNPSFYRYGPVHALSDLILSFYFFLTFTANVLFCLPLP